MSREDFEEFALRQFNATVVPRIVSEGAPRVGEYEDKFWQLGWEFWQTATERAIRILTNAQSMPINSTLPGAIVLPGDFFAKVK